MLCYSLLCHCISCYVVLLYVMLCYVMLCYYVILLCLVLYYYKLFYAMLYLVVLLYVMSKNEHYKQCQVHMPNLPRVFYACGTWWRIGRVETFRPEGRGLESRSNRHVGTLGKSFTCSCLWRFGVKLRHSIRAVLGPPFSSSGLEEALHK